MSRPQGHVGRRFAFLTKLLFDTYFMKDDINSHSTPFSSNSLRTFCSLLNANSSFHSLVLCILFLLINAERLSFSSLNLVLARRSLVPPYFFLANWLFVFFGWKSNIWYKPEMYLIFACDTPEKCLKYTWDMAKIYLRYSLDMPEIYHTYTWNIPEKYLVYTWYIPGILMRYSWDIPEIWLRYT